MTGLLDEASIAHAYIDACRLDVATLKPGNVHVHAAGHGMQVRDFEMSAKASAPFIADASLRVGTRIRRAIDATFDAVGCNTNLGIVLLCAPIAAAAGRDEPGHTLADRLDHVLNTLDEHDATEVFQAIARANPAGLGAADEGDVHRAPPPGMTLMRAMELAADRDLIAAEYRSRFHDLLAGGLSAYEARRAKGLGETQALAALYMRTLASVADTHIARKHGCPAAERVRARAAEVLAALPQGAEGDLYEPEAFRTLMSFDAELKEQGLNPGSLADLMAATAFLAMLRSRIARNYL